MDTVPARCGLSLSQASPSPNAPVPVFASPSLVSVAPAAGSRAPPVPATDELARAPDVHAPRFLAALKKIKNKKK